MTNFKSYCDLLRKQLDAVKDADIRNQILKKLVQKIEVTPSSFKIHYYVGKDVVESRLENLMEIQQVDRVENKKPEGAYTASGLKVVVGSNRLTFGVTDGV